MCPDAWNFEKNYQEHKTLGDNVKMNVSLDDMLNIRKNYGSSFSSIEQLYLSNGSGTKIDGIYYYMMNEEELLATTTKLWGKF